MAGIARVYDHVTPLMLRQVDDALQARWLASLAALEARDRDHIGDLFPELRMDLHRGAA